MRLRLDIWRGREAIGRSTIRYPEEAEARDLILHMGR
jgi:hypothetical protein